MASIAGTEMATGGAGGVPPRTGNRVLDALSPSPAAILPGLEAFPAHAELAPGYAVFPAPGTVLARVLVLADGRVAQVSLIGARGFAAGPHHDPLARDRLQTLVPGHAWRVPNSQFETALARSEALRQAVAAEDRRLLQEAWQGIACAAVHQVEQRLAHWLLAVRAEAAQGVSPPGDVPVTQALLATLLGLRRTTVTRAMMTLEERGLIQHRRSRVAILDRPGLEAAACACHGLGRSRSAAL